MWYVCAGSANDGEAVKSVVVAKVAVSREVRDCLVGVKREEWGGFVGVLQAVVVADEEMMGDDGENIAAMECGLRLVDVVAAVG